MKAPGDNHATYSLQHIVAQGGTGQAGFCMQAVKATAFHAARRTTLIRIQRRTETISVYV